GQGAQFEAVDVVIEARIEQLTFGVDQFFSMRNIHLIRMMIGHQSIADILADIENKVPLRSEYTPLQFRPLPINTRNMADQLEQGHFAEDGSCGDIGQRGQSGWCRFWLAL